MCIFDQKTPQATKPKREEPKKTNEAQTVAAADRVSRLGADSLASTVLKKKTAGAKLLLGE